MSGKKIPINRINSDFKIFKVIASRPNTDDQKHLTKADIDAFIGLAKKHKAYEAKAKHFKNIIFLNNYLETGIESALKADASYKNSYALVMGISITQLFRLAGSDGILDQADFEKFAQFCGISIEQAKRILVGFQSKVSEFNRTLAQGNKRPDSVNVKRSSKAHSQPIKRYPQYVTFTSIFIDQIPDTLPFLKQLAKQAPDFKLTDVAVNWLFKELKLGQLDPIVRQTQFAINGLVSLDSENSFNSITLFRYNEMWKKFLTNKRHVVNGRNILEQIGIHLPVLVKLLARASEVLRGKMNWVYNDSQKFKNHPKIKAAETLLSSTLQSAFAQDSNRFGLNVTLPKRPTGVMRILDTVHEKGCKQTRNKTYASFHYDSEIITVSAEALVSGRTSSIRHEINHLWLYQAVGGGDNYRKIPEWFREGLAVVAAAQIGSREAEAITDFGSEVLATQLNKKGYHPHLYYNVGVAVYSLISRYGGHLIGKIIGEVRSGHTFGKALSLHIPGWQDEETFYLKLRQDTKARMEKTIDPSARQAYLLLAEKSIRGAKKFYNKIIPNAAVSNMIFSSITALQTPKARLVAFRPEWTEFARKFGNTRFGGAASFFLGLIEYQLGNTDRASRLFKKVKNMYGEGKFSEMASTYLAIIEAAGHNAKVDAIKKICQRTLNPEARRGAKIELMRKKGKYKRR